jgi:hypothetical protein
MSLLANLVMASFRYLFLMHKSTLFVEALEWIHAHMWSMT